MSASVTSASRLRGQYSQIWLSHLRRLPLAASRSASLTRALKVALCSPLSSSSSTATTADVAAWSSAWMRWRMVPRRWQAAPRLGGSEEAMSRRMREESLQPLPLVVMPIWRGPSVWVERREKVQRDGASTMLMGTRLRLQWAEMWRPGGGGRLVFGILEGGLEGEKGKTHSADLVG